MKVKRTILGVVLTIVLLLIVGVIVFVVYLDRIVKTAIETQATKSLKLDTKLDSASVSLFGGTLGLNELKIASPVGFDAPHMLTLGKGNVTVEHGQLRNNPVHVKKIVLTQPMLMIENKGNVLNFKRASELMHGSPPPAAPDGSPGTPQPQPQPQPQPAPQPSSAPPPAPAEQKEQMKLIIDELVVENAKVVVRHGFPIPSIPPEFTLNVPTFTMKNIGTGDGAQNGAAVKDVAMQIITALAAQATTSGLLPPELAEFQKLLKGDLSAVMKQLGPEAQKRVMEAVPGEAGKLLGSIVADPSALMKDPGKVIGDKIGAKFPAATNPAGALQDLIPRGAGAGGPTTQPAGPLQIPGLDPAKTPGGLGDLLGGGKKKDK